MDECDCPHWLLDPAWIRMEQIVDSFRSGKTLAEIGTRFGISRERVSQLLEKYGIDAKTGGGAERARQRRANRIATRDADSMRVWGMLPSERELWRRTMPKPYLAYQRQKANAGKRGIPWEFTLADWWSVWEKSGKWELRGIGAGRFVMGRKGDVGPYAKDNVEIITHEQNSKDCRAKYFKPKTPEERRAEHAAYARAWRGKMKLAKLFRSHT